MTDYVAEDGLKVLEYIGITNITEEEKEVFKEKWKQTYEGHDKDLVGTTWHLYSEVLPFTCGDADRGSFVVQTVRDSDFGKRLEITGLEKELEQETPLEEILKKGPHRFIKSFKL